MYSGFLKETTLVALAYDLEQAIKLRTQRNFSGPFHRSRRMQGSVRA